MNDNSNGFEKWIDRVIDDSGSKIKDSCIYMSVFTTNFKKDPRCALELGMAILLDKPIGILVFNDVEIPENIKKVATAIEFCKEGDVKSYSEASKRLIEKCSEKVKK